MKSFCLAAILAVTISADASDFPKDSFNHAGCHLSATFDQQQCSTVYALMDDIIRQWANGDACAASGHPGHYSIFEEQNDSYIWSKRLTADGKYTDDQLFQFAETDAGCQVTGKSNSESISMYDYGVNFCNLWNVYNTVGGATVSKASHCSVDPSDPVTTCARY